MKRKLSNEKSSSIFLKISRPILVTLIFIFAFFTLIFHENVLQYMKTNAVQMFSDKVENRGIHMQTEMNNRASMVSSIGQITAKIEDILAAENATLEQMKEDGRINQKILKGVMGDAISALRASGVTEFFLILSEGSQSSSGHSALKDGIYLRNSNPDFYSGNNEGLLLERGMSDLSKSWGIPLDRFWSARFFIGGKDDKDSAYYTKPFHAAAESKVLDYENFIYWSFGYPIHPSDKGILSYSIPLIASDGTVFGVVGMGIEEGYFNSRMDFRELGQEGKGAYLLATTTDGVHFEPVIFNGSYFNKSSFLFRQLEIRTPEGSPISYLYQPGESKSELCVVKQKLTLYNRNTPFTGEQWYLLGINHEASLFSGYNMALKMLIALVIIGVLISGVGVFWTSRLIVNPIQRLVEELRSSDPNRPIHLERVHVGEVDELVSSIESLSSRMAAAYSRISTIIEISEAGIGVFEYKEKENLVFCNRILYELLNWTPPEDCNTYVDGTEFRKIMKSFLEYQVPHEPDLFRIPLDSDNYRWLKLKRETFENSVLGVVTDVTLDILEREKIIYERDYDILTDILNRRGFQKHMSELFQKPDVLKNAAMIVWDLDNLKNINDSFGHTMGDTFIISLGASLKEFSGENIVSARRSGDEFVTFIFGKDTEEDVSEIIQALWNKTQNTYLPLSNGVLYKVKVSAGVSLYPRDSRDFEELFEFADFALYTAKYKEKGSLSTFDRLLYNAEEETWLHKNGMQNALRRKN